jgi:CheY-like chemotaxis protein
MVLSLLEYIRAIERLQRVPVILLTAKARDRIAGYKAGADVLLKPSIQTNSSHTGQCYLHDAGKMQAKRGMVDLKQDMASIKELLKQKWGQRIKRLMSI